jgi:hypothetical protein
VTLPYRENGPEGACFASKENIKSNATAELQKIPKKNPLPMLATMAESMEQVCAERSYFEGN